jgi:arsenite methyltransferase
VLRPGGRLALADIVSGKPLKEKTRRNIELGAACIARAIPQTSYIDTIQAAGFRPRPRARQQLPFVSERALSACNTNQVESFSLAATKPA